MSVVVLEHESEALKDNPLGDPHVRPLHLIVSKNLEPGQPVPCVWYLAGYAGVGRGLLSHDPWQEGLAERMERLEAEGQIGPMIVALPDAFTKFGGSQYLSSPAHGDYETYLVSELRTLVERRYEISSHAVAGKSSGGYGALALSMRHPGAFSAAVCHSGDMGFRLAYTQDLPSLMNALEDYGSLEALVSAFDQAKKKKDGRWFGPMAVLAMACAYSPDPAQPLNVALPFHLETGSIDEEVFARWLALDPVQMVDVPELRAGLLGLKGLFIDCGRRDEHHLRWGARGLVSKLERYGVAHDYEEFEDGHRSTSYRLDVSLPWLYRALSSAE